MGEKPLSAAPSTDESDARARLANQEIDEASGIAASRRSTDLFWVHNDSGGGATLYAVSNDGGASGRATLIDAQNIDWEDLAAFTMGEQPMLMIADIGDNEARRPHVSLYIVAEPEFEGNTNLNAPVDWRVDFRYPEGPRDAEAVAVDTANANALILSKRDVPPILYTVSLRPGSTGVRIAEELVRVESLPKPTSQAMDDAPKTREWFWQPTAMDISRDGSAIAILTYNAVYLYSRTAEENWAAALQRTPRALDLLGLRDAEALAFSADGRSLFVTAEKKHARLLEITLDEQEANPNLQ